MTEGMGGTHVGEFRVFITCLGPPLPHMPMGCKPWPSLHMLLLLPSTESQNSPFPQCGSAEQRGLQSRSWYEVPRLKGTGFTEGPQGGMVGGPGLDWGPRGEGVAVQAWARGQERWGRVWGGGHSARQMKGAWPQVAGAGVGGGHCGPRPRGPPRVARGRGGRRLVAGRAGGAGGGALRAGHPAARPRPRRSSPRPARAPAAARPPPAATMSTGLRYKSKLATPGEPGARQRARARLCPRRLPVSHRVSPFLPRPPARNRPDPDPDWTPTLTQQKTSRYVRAAVHPAGCHLLW